MDQAMDYWQALANSLWGRETVSLPLLREGAEGTNLRISLFTACSCCSCSCGVHGGDYTEFADFERALAAK